MNILLYRAVAVLLWFWSSFALANPFAQIYPDKAPLYETHEALAEYRLTLSPLKKINGEWLAERETIVRGAIHQRTILLDHHYSLNGLWLNVLGQVNTDNSREIFSCEGLDCGSSNAWANTRFEIKQLYGLDQQQFYLVREFLDERGQASAYAVLYLVERGDRRIYLQMDYIVLAEPRLAMMQSPAIIAKAFFQRGVMRVPGVELKEGVLNIAEAPIATLAVALNAQPYKRLTVVSVVSGDADTEKAQEHAQRVIEKLVSFGVSARRLQAKVEHVDGGEFLSGEVLIRLR